MTAPPPAKPLRAPGTLPAFTPVPRLTARRDGWNAQRQQDFI
ncbi:hypothetical protein [Allopontixanthobacter sediminis]|nr:hypothetical protein [Allopontixanthobacter sediminis]